MTVPVPEQITVQFTPSNGAPPFKIDNWTSYTFDSDFFTPTDAFTLELADDRVDQLRNKINVGDDIQLLVNDTVQCTGRVDRVRFHQNRGSGTVLTLSGRDKLGVVCDAHINPGIQKQFKPNTPYSVVLSSIFFPFGFQTVNIKDTDDGFDRSVASGGKQGKAIKAGKRNTSRSLTAFINRQIKPHKGEGYMEFAQRIAQRSGWNIKTSVDGKTVNVFSPSYDRDSGILFHLQRSVEQPDANNVMDGSLEVNWTNQPSVIIAECVGGGGDFRQSMSKVIYVNDLTGYDNNGNILTDGTGNPDTDLQALVNFYQAKGTKPVPLNDKLRASIGNFIVGVNQDLKQAPQRAEFFYDQYENVSTDELEFIVRQKMNHRQLEFFTLHYEVNGHSMLDNGAIWAINCMCNIHDEVLGLDGAYWIKRRTFTKSRSGGTKTQLQLCLPYIFDL